MYMITLLIVIVSLTLVEGYSTKSEIRFGYGLLYEHRGQLLHGLNKYHLLVGVEMPKFSRHSSKNIIWWSECFYKPQKSIQPFKRQRNNC